METYEKIYRDLCRVCLKQSSLKMVPLLEDIVGDGLTSYGKAVTTFVDVNITAKDDLPSKMCRECLHLLRHAIKFKLNCERSDRRLRKLLTECKNKHNFKDTLIQYSLYMRYFPEESVETLDKTEIPTVEDKPVIIVEDDKKLILDEIKNIFIENDNTSEIDSKDDTNEGINDYNTAINDKDAEELDFNDEHLNNDCTDDIDVLLHHMEKLVGIECDETPVLMEKEKEESDTKQVSIKDWEQYRLKRKRRREMLARWKVKNGVQPVNRPKTTSVKSKENAPQKCDQCGKVLANKHTLLCHMRRHLGSKYICEHCGKGYASRPELEFHLGNQHGVGNVLQCEHCSFKSPSKYILVEHVRLHTGERPYACDKCGLTFRRKYLYNKHKVHHFEKTVQCPQCPRRFYHRSHMLQHSNNVHERRYVYTCARCGALYAKPASLRRHLTAAHAIPRHLQPLLKVYSSSEAPTR